MEELIQFSYLAIEVHAPCIHGIHSPIISILQFWSFKLEGKTLQKTFSSQMNYSLHTNGAHFKSIERTRKSLLRVFIIEIFLFYECFRHIEYSSEGRDFTPFIWNIEYIPIIQYFLKNFQM